MPLRDRARWLCFPLPLPSLRCPAMGRTRAQNYKQKNYQQERPRFQVTMAEKIVDLLLHDDTAQVLFCKLLHGDSIMGLTGSENGEYNRRAYQKTKAEAKAAGMGVYAYRQLRKGDRPC